jgi:glycosyltransferase involved in cell wall biosynthesis
MRILLVGPMLPQADGPGAIPMLLHSEIVGLSERHDVTFITGIGDEPGEEDAVRALAGLGVEFHIADRRQPPPGRRRLRRRLRLAATWARGRWPWRTVWFADPGIQRMIDQLSATRVFDVVAIEDSSMATFRLPAGVAAVLTEHEVRRPRQIDWPPGSPRSWHRWAFRELDWQRWRRFQRTIWRRFDRLQVFTPRDAGAIEDLAPDVVPRVRVNPFGLVLPSIPDSARQLDGLVLFVGNFTHPPNCDAAVWLARDIMPEVRARYSSARLRIIGAAPPREVLQLASPGVEVIADPAEIDGDLEAACVVLAPVRTGGGMRMKVLHALAHGKAVVTTPRGIEGYAISGRSPPLVVAESAEEIAQATAQLLGDENRRRELASRARAFAQEHHSPTAWAHRLERVYEEAVADRARSSRG